MENSHSASTTDRKKWYVLLCISTIFLATYHCISGISALESELISTFDLSHSEFALLSSIVFGCAMISAIICPFILGRILSLPQILLASCILVFIGQTIFVSVCISTFEWSLALLFLARILIGIGYGLQMVSVFCTVHLWFTGTQWLPFAIYVISITFDIGLIIGKYAYVPLYEISHGLLSLPFSLGIALALISVIACIIVLRMDMNQNTVVVQLDRDLRKVRFFSLNVWLLIIAILIPSAFLDITGTLMTQPLMDIFNLSEYQSDMILSIIPLLDISLGFAFAWAASTFGYLSFYLLFTPVLYFIAYAIIYFSTSTVLPSFVIAIISMVAFAFATEAWFASSYACLFLSCQPQYISIVNASVSILRLSASMLGCFVFGVMEDSEDGMDGRSPILLMVVLTVVLLIVILAVFIMDYMNGGVLHLSWNEREKMEEERKREEEYVEDGQSKDVEEAGKEKGIQSFEISETQPLLK